MQKGNQFECLTYFELVTTFAFYVSVFWEVRPVAAFGPPVGSALEMLALSCLFLVGGNPLVIEVNYINILND